MVKKQICLTALFVAATSAASPVLARAILPPVLPPAPPPAPSDVSHTNQLLPSFLSNSVVHILNSQPDTIRFVPMNQSGGAENASAFGASGNAGRANVDDTFLLLNSGHVQSDPRFIKRIANAFRVSAPKHHGQRSGAATETKLGSTHAADAQAVGNFATAPTRTGTWEVWGELQGSRSSYDDTDNRHVAGHAGIHYFISEETILGIAGQIDSVDSDNSNFSSDIEGDGWMAGPYLAGRFYGTSTFYELRGAWGRSSNKVSPRGTYSDGFDTTRWLLSGKMEGRYDLGNGIEFNPWISGSYAEESSDAYTDELAGRISSQDVSVADIRFGPKVVNRTAMSDGTLVATSLGITGIYQTVSGEGNNSNLYDPADDGFRGRADAGVSFTGPSGASLIAGVFYDGLGADDYRAYGGSVKLSVPLQ